MREICAHTRTHYQLQDDGRPDPDGGEGRGAAGSPGGHAQPYPRRGVRLHVHVLTYPALHIHLTVTLIQSIKESLLVLNYNFNYNLYA